jgi:hypothetical protein
MIKEISESLGEMPKGKNLKRSLRPEGSTPFKDNW